MSSKLEYLKKNKYWCILIIIIILSRITPYALWKFNNLIYFPDKREEEIVRLVVGKPEGGIDYEDIFKFTMYADSVGLAGDITESGRKRIFSTVAREEWENYYSTGNLDIDERTFKIRFYFFNKDNPKYTITIEDIHIVLNTMEFIPEDETFEQYCSWYWSKGANLQSTLNELSKNYVYKLFNKTNIAFEDLDINQIIEFDKYGTVTIDEVTYTE